MKNNKTTLSNKIWLIILGAIVIVSAVATVLIWRAPTSHARIYIDNVLVEVVDLSAVTDRREILVKRGNVANVVAVEYGRIRMYSANCPDHICVRQGWFSGGLMPIVCLPNRVVIVLDSVDNNIDAVVG